MFCCQCCHLILNRQLYLTILSLMQMMLGWPIHSPLSYGSTIAYCPEHFSFWPGAPSASALGRLEMLEEQPSNSGGRVRNKEWINPLALWPQMGLLWSMLYMLRPKFLSRIELQLLTNAPYYYLYLLIDSHTLLLAFPEIVSQINYLNSNLSGIASERTQTRTCNFFMWKLEMIISILWRYCEH